MAEEKKKAAQPKLDYDQLKAYASQLEAQARKVFEENQMMRKALNSRDIEYAFRCLDHADKFSKEFITKVVNRLEELLTPDREVPENKEIQEDKEEE